MNIFRLENALSCHFDGGSPAHRFVRFRGQDAVTPRKSLPGADGRQGNASMQKRGLFRSANNSANQPWRRAAGLIRCAFLHVS
jgi:hypothetical protein